MQVNDHHSEIITGRVWMSLSGCLDLAKPIGGSQIWSNQ